MHKSQKANKPKLAFKFFENETLILADWAFEGKSDSKGYIDFLEEIYYIEQAFNIEFKLPNLLFTDWELYTVDLIYHSLKGNDLKSNIEGGYTLFLDNHNDIQELFRCFDEYGFLNAFLDIQSKEAFDLLGL